MQHNYTLHQSTRDNLSLCHSYTSRLAIQCRHLSARLAGVSFQRSYSCSAMVSSLRVDEERLVFKRPRRLAS